MASTALALVIAIALTAPSPASIIVGSAWVDDASGTLDGADTMTVQQSGPFVDAVLGTGAQIIENIGQAGHANGALYLKGRGASVIFHTDRIIVILGSGEALSDRSMYEVIFEGSNPVAPEGVDPTGTRYNYFLGNDSARWVSGARGFAGVRYTGLWDGIDLVYRLVDGYVKYDIIVSPGANVSSARLTYEGVDSLSLDPSSGMLLVGLPTGTVTDAAPVSFQDGPHGRDRIESRFAFFGPRTVGFWVSGYDASRPLDIDPELLFSSYLGSSGTDYLMDCALGPDGELYVLGATDSTVFPTTPGAFDRSFNGDYDVYVSKFTIDGTTLISSTFIGGSNDDNQITSSGGEYRVAYGGLRVDSLGNVLVTGNTLSGDFPTTAGAYDRTYSTGDYDAFILKLNSDCSQLIFSTLLGGSAAEWPIDIAIDSEGNPVISGYCQGTVPMTTGAFDSHFDGSHDGFVAKLSSAGDRLLYSSYIGGTASDVAYAVAVDADDHIHVGGYTQTTNFPTTAGAYDTSGNGGWDSFVLELAEDGSSLTFSTLVGGNNWDLTMDLALDDQGRPYIVGHVQSGGMPTVAGCYDTSYNGGDDVFICRFSADGSKLERSTYFGSDNSDRAFNIAIDPFGDVIVAGMTLGTIPTTANAYSTSNQGNHDAFVAKFDADLTTLTYGSMFGGSSSDKAWGLALEPMTGATYFAGDTISSDFPTTANAYDRVDKSGLDAFIIKLGGAHPPAWLPLATFMAVEDVPLTVDFAPHVTDPTTPVENLRISSVSPYVSSISGLEVTFQFPNGITEASVPLVLSDEDFMAVGDINFTITPVNDPPICLVPLRHTVTEDVPYTIEFGLYAADIDNATDDLRLLVSSPYANVTGLNLTLTYPDGVRTDLLWVNVSDGLLAAEVALELSILPVDDPPVVLAIPPFVAVEDHDSVLNITPYLVDVDTPLEDLAVMVRDENCSVIGKELHFLFHLPVNDLPVTLEVADSHSRVAGVIIVSATPVNDPPVTGTVPPQLLVEGEPSSIDLSPYIMDEDTQDLALVLGCQSPFFVKAEGLNLVLLYDAWVPEHTVEFSVFDGIALASGSITIQVEAVNDPPVILGIGTLEPPVIVSMREGDELWLAVRVTDEDSTAFRYTVSSPWKGITAFQNGTLRVLAVQADVGGHNINLTVDDLAGGVTTLQFSVVVSNVDDPPTAPIITSPLNHTTVEEGTNVTFRVDVYDPDMSLGQVLTVTWVSNVSGLLMTLTSDGKLAFTTDALPVGDHRIDVTVTDGTHVITAWLELTVTERYVPPPPPPEEPSFFTRPAGIAAVLIVVVLVVIGVLLGISWTRRRLAEREAEEEERARAEAERQRAAEADVEITMGGDLARLHRDLGEMVTQLEAQRAAEASVAATTTPSPPLEPVLTVPTVEDEADRERTREMREVMRALTQLPQGLPTSLSGWDMAELARTIVDGEKRTAADGTPLVIVKGRWYCADRSNVGTFAREWKEPAPAPGGPLTTTERAMKLEKLETALLEGKITEETYRELKAKYERG